MAETMQTLEELSTLKPAAAPQPPKYVQKLDKQGRAYATGKRKDAVARVWIKMGAGKIIINDRPVETYFARPVLRMMIQQPLVASNRQGQYDVVCTVSGGGLSGPGRRRAPWLVQGADAARARSARRAQARRLPHPRPARGRAQEIRPRQSPPQLPVLEAVIVCSPPGARREGSRSRPIRAMVVSEKRHRADFDALARPRVRRRGRIVERGMRGPAGAAVFHRSYTLKTRPLRAACAGTSTICAPDCI